VSYSRSAQSKIRSRLEPWLIDVLKAANNYAIWDRIHNGGLLEDNKASNTRFELAILSYYETRRPSDGSLRTPENVVPEFTQLYQSSRWLIDEIARSKENLTVADVRSLAPELIRYIPRLPLPDMDKLQRAQLKNLIQRIFRAHAKFDPQVIDEGTDEDVEISYIQDTFTQGLKTIVKTFQEALPDRSALQQSLIVLVAIAFAVSIYYSILSFGIPWLWNSGPSKVFHNTKLGGESIYAHSNLSSISLSQRLLIYKDQMNMTVVNYEMCDIEIIRAVDSVLRRTERLSTDLQIVGFTIWLSQLRPIRPLCRMFNLASETSMNEGIADLYQGYFSDIERQVSYADSTIEILRTNLMDLRRSAWQMEHHGYSPFDLHKLIFDVIDLPIASFTRKKRRKSISPVPPALPRLHEFNNLVGALTEGFVLQLRKKLRSLKEVVSAQVNGDNPLPKQITEIRKAVTSLRTGKEVVLQLKKSLETKNGPVREAKVAVEEL
jgi:hypothetical protein